MSFRPRLTIVAYEISRCTVYNGKRATLAEVGEDVKEGGVEQKRAEEMSARVNTENKA